jgi:hypothetical protein
MGKKSGSGSGIRDEQPGSYFLELRNNFFGVKILKFLDADSGSGMIISDPGTGMEKSRIWNKHSGSATLKKIHVLVIVTDPDQANLSGSDHHRFRITTLSLFNSSLIRKLVQWYILDVSNVPVIVNMYLYRIYDLSVKLLTKVPQCFEVSAVPVKRSCFLSELRYLDTVHCLPFTVQYNLRIGLIHVT